MIEDNLSVITDSLIALNKAVKGSKIVKEQSGLDIPYCTVDGKRQVISVGDLPGYDLWVPKKNPTFGKIIDDFTCSDFGVSFEQAVEFLNGTPMNVIRSHSKQSDINPASNNTATVSFAPNQKRNCRKRLPTELKRNWT